VAANSEYIAMTLRLTNEQYRAFHAILIQKGASKSKVLRILVERYIQEERVKPKRLA